MFSTKSVNSLRKLFAGFHEPAPLSKQQSQRLLDGLKTSFRSQLELEYGQSSDTSTTSTTPANVAETNRQIRHSAASQHVKSILSNPLFSYNKDAIPALPSSLSVPKRDPMDVFDHAVAKGMMTLKAATGCMMAKQQQCSAQGSFIRMGSSETAARVVRWLRSSETGVERSFLDNKAFIRALTPFLLAEGMEGVAWEWITQSVNDSSWSATDEQRIRRASYLLAELVRTKSQPQYGNLDAAITTILEAEEIFQKSALLPRLLVLPWRSVSWLSTVESYSRTAPSERLFDAHMATAERLPQAFPVENAHLHLYHPTHPDHTPALQFFKDKQKLREFVQGLNLEKLNLGKAKGMSIVPWITFLGHDTVNHLTQSGRSQEAQGVTELLHSELASLFPDSLEPA